MKVLLLPSWYPNRNIKTGSFFKEQAQFLNKNGFDVKVLMAEELHTENYFYQRLKRCFGRKYNQLNKIYLEQKPDAFSFPVIIQKSWSDQKKLEVMDNAYLRAFKTLTQTQDWFPEIIHLQGMYKYGLSSYLIADKYSLPLVVIEHSPFKMFNYSAPLQERIKRIFVLAKKLAGVSHYHKKSLTKGGVKRAVEVVWNFMDEQKFSYQKPLKTDNIFRITTILRASSVKDPITFFDSVLRFFEKITINKPIEVHVVGLSSLKDILKMKGIDDNFISKYDKLMPMLKFYTWLDRFEIMELIQNSHVYLSTSREETYGIALREAMLCGLPVISTRSGGPEDTLDENIGLLVDKGDADKIAVHLKSIYEGKLIFNPTDIRNHVISQSGREAFLSRMEKFYNI